MISLGSCKNDATNKDDALQNETSTEAIDRQKTYGEQKATKINNKQQNADNVKNKLVDSKETTAVDWLTVEEAEKNGNKEGKMYLIDVYTDWCGWCKVMDKKTFSDPETVEYLKKNFHLIKLNAEQKEPISFKGKKYEWVPKGKKGVNSFAKEMLGSRMSYPTIVYLDKNMNKIKSSPGFKDPAKLMAELESL